MSNILQVGPMMPALAQSLRDDYGAVVLPSDPGEREAFLNEHGDEITAVVTSVIGGADAELIAALPKLAVIVNFGVGYDSVDVDAAVRRGIVVSNTPDVLTDAVADTAVGLMIDTLRQFSAADRFVRAGRWPQGIYPLTREVSNSRVGILGLGRIGSAIAKRVSAFGCEISYHSRHRVADSPYRYASSPEELARDVDVLIVATAGGGDTANLVDRAVLDALGPDGYLINIARGSVVDEPAMVEALATGRLAGAGLDVYADEPHVPERLLGLDNVVLLPHVGSATVQTRAAMAALTLRNLDSFLKTGRLVTPVPECRAS
nr:2-hydroxyacid dehydrogenase [Mycolicibacterium komanii]CRL70160.1 D-isomer specific 2-hydroxyacid dehydrogenase [Mycolicibacterium komanii]